MILPVLYIAVGAAWLYFEGKHRGRDDGYIDGHTDGLMTGRASAFSEIARERTDATAKPSASEHV